MITRNGFIYTWILALLAVFLGYAPLAVASEVPCFGQYTTPVSTGSNAAVDFSSHPNAEKFRAQLERVAGNKPNFAGHYILLTPSCGNFCQSILILDTKTGKVYFPAITGMGDWKQYLVGWHVEKITMNSRLLLIKAQLTTVPRSQSSSLDGPFRNGMLYYQWTGNSLAFIEKRFVD